MTELKLKSDPPAKELSESFAEEHPDQPDIEAIEAFDVGNLIELVI